MVELIPVNAEPSIAGSAPDKFAEGIVLFIPSTSNVESSPNTEPLISPVVTVTPPVSRLVTLRDSSAKLSLILSKAVLNGSPSPLFALVPMFITCIAIIIYLLQFLFHQFHHCRNFVMLYLSPYPV